VGGFRVTDEYVQTLNEMGFEPHDEEVEVTGVEEYGKDVDVMKMEETNSVFSHTKTVRMVDIHFVNGEEIEMKYTHFEDMIHRYRNRP